MNKSMMIWALLASLSATATLAPAQTNANPSMTIVSVASNAYPSPGDPITVTATVYDSDTVGGVQVDNDSTSITSDIEDSFGSDDVTYIAGNGYFSEEHHVVAPYAARTYTINFVAHDNGGIPILVDTVATDHLNIYVFAP